MLKTNSSLWIKKKTPSGRMLKNLKGQFTKTTKKDSSKMHLVLQFPLHLVRFSIIFYPGTCVPNTWVTSDNLQTSLSSIFSVFTLKTNNWETVFFLERHVCSCHVFPEPHKPNSSRLHHMEETAEVWGHFKIKQTICLAKWEYMYLWFVSGLAL